MIRISRSAVDAVWVSAGSYALFAAMFGVTVIINRAYGTAELGRFGMAWAIAQLTVQASSSGFQGIHKREVAYGTRAIADLVAETLAVRLVGLFLIVTLSAIVLRVLKTALPFAMPILMVLLAKTIEAVGLALAETLQASGNNQRYAALSAFNALVLLASVGTVWYLGLNSEYVYLAVIVAAILYTSVSWVIFAQMHGRPRVRASPSRMRALVQESWPLIINAIVFVGVSRAAVVTVGAMSGTTQAGVFTFASGIVGAFAVVASAVGMVAFPGLCQTFLHEPGELRGKMFRLAGQMAVVGLSALVILLVVEGLILRIYGTLPPYASDVVLALGAGLVPIFVTVSGSYMFTAIGQQKEGMYAAFFNAVVVLSLLVPLTHLMGALGAAIAVSSAQGITCIGLLVWLDRRHLVKFAVAASLP